MDINAWSNSTKLVVIAIICAIVLLAIVLGANQFAGGHVSQQAVCDSNPSLARCQ